MSNIVDDQAMENNETVSSVNPPIPSVLAQTLVQVLPLPPLEMRTSPVGSRSPLCAQSVSPTPRYAPYIIPLVSTQHNGVMLGEMLGAINETIQSHIDELSRQVSTVTTPLTEHV